MDICNTIDRGRTGFVSTEALENILASTGLTPDEVAEVMDAMATPTSGPAHPQQMVDIVAFIRTCNARSHTEAIRKLGVLLRCRHNSLMQHVRAWGILPPVMRPGLVSQGRSRGLNQPSSILYPNLDSSALPLAVRKVALNLI